MSSIINPTSPLSAEPIPSGGFDILGLENSSNRLNGSDQSDSITGGNLSDILCGLAGNDTINGLVGADSLDGGSGQDRLIAEGGGNTLTGGSGTDRFEIDITQRLVNALDQITDYQRGEKIIITGNASTGDIDYNQSTGRLSLNGQEVIQLSPGLDIDLGDIEYIEMSSGNTDRVPFYRFQNSAVPGTYLYAAGTEAQNVRNNFPGFVEEGLAFNAAIEPGDDLIPLYRLQSRPRPGTYIFVGEEELNNITTDPNLSNNFIVEGIAFYVYDGAAEKGTDFIRFQNSAVPGTYLYASGSEADIIRENFPNFIEEGVAFEL
ncbi:MAG: calcium-binding protein [Xenococcus sp. (in: cyanobacteria)]